MIKAIKSKQLMINVNNKVGSLAEITEVVSRSEINLIAICAYAVDNRGIIMFVAEDNTRAKKLLKSKDYDVREEEVILLTIDNKPGTLQALTKKIAAAGFDLTLLYGSVEKDSKVSRLVLISENNDAVLMTIRLK